MRSIRSFYPVPISCAALAAGSLACSSLKHDERVDAGFGGLDPGADCGLECDTEGGRGDGPVNDEQRDAPDEVDRIPEHSVTGEPRKGYKFRGYFLDLRTLAFALTDISYSLEGACEAFL